MKSIPKNILNYLKSLPPDLAQKYLEEYQTGEHIFPVTQKKYTQKDILSIYDYSDFELLLQKKPQYNYLALLKSLDELLSQDQQREKDGFPRKIRLGKLLKPAQGQKSQVIIVPTTTEPKLYHDDIKPEQEFGGTGKGETGEVIGRQKANDEGEEEGEGQGAGNGEGGQHQMLAEAFDIGKLLTERFELPNLQTKGNKKSLTKMQYDLTDRNEGTGQILDKKSTLKKIIQTNILLGNINKEENPNPESFLISPKDKIYQILSPEKDIEAQAMVFFVRDYSGSMQGKPTEVVTLQHLLIYSWLYYQFNKQVETKFILHDTEAKEVDDFYTYYKASVAGGTNVYPAFELMVNIIEEQNLAKDYNIYIFYGTDGDDWESHGEKTLKALEKLLPITNRIGITIAKGYAGSGLTTVERYLESSGILKDKIDLIRLDSLLAEQAGESRVIEGIKKLIS
jgi:uncharacterized sporulation protein YeaH/YhbH (DUF444 family)